MLENETHVKYWRRSPEGEVQGDVPTLYIAPKSLGVGELAVDCKTWGPDLSFSPISSASTDNDFVVAERRAVNSALVEDQQEQHTLVADREPLEVQVVDEIHEATPDVEWSQACSLE